jgi:hypothetical protein
MAAYILTIADEDGDVFFQKSGDSESELKAAAIEWMREENPDYFDEDGQLEDARSNSVEDNYERIGESALGAPRPVIRKAGKQ